MGAALIINRSEAGYAFWKDENTQDPKGVAPPAPARQGCSRRGAALPKAE